MIQDLESFVREHSQRQTARLALLRGAPPFAAGAESSRKALPKDVPGLVRCLELLATFNGIAWAILIVSITRFFTGGEVSFAAGFLAGVFLAILTLVTRLACLVVARGLSIVSEMEKHARASREAIADLLERTRPPEDPSTEPSGEQEEETAEDREREEVVEPA